MYVRCTKNNKRIFKVYFENKTNDASFNKEIAIELQEKTLLLIKIEYLIEQV